MLVEPVLSKCSVQTAVLCGSVAVLNSFKKLLLRLEQCRMYEQQQTMSDEPGRLMVVIKYW